VYHLNIVPLKSKNPPKRVLSDLTEVPSSAVLAMVDLPDPERVLRFRVGAD
jgi:hypothetical protein